MLTYNPLSTKVTQIYITPDRGYPINPLRVHWFIETTWEGFDKPTTRIIQDGCIVLTEEGYKIEGSEICTPVKKTKRELLSELRKTNACIIGSEYLDEDEMEPVTFNIISSSFDCEYIWAEMSPSDAGNIRNSSAGIYYSAEPICVLYAKEVSGGYLMEWMHEKFGKTGDKHFKTKRQLRKVLDKLPASCSIMPALTHKQP